MRLLLDTHIWLWYALGDPQLSKNLRATIAADTTELWLSPISIWEVLLLAERGRISLKVDAVTWIEQLIAALAICEAPLDRHIAILSRQIQLPHQDPADRSFYCSDCTSLPNAACHRRCQSYCSFLVNYDQLI